MHRHPLPILEKNQKIPTPQEQRRKGAATAQGQREAMMKLTRPNHESR